MARNFKMFNHIVDPPTRFRLQRFITNKPLESFLIVSFIYMSLCLFSWRSLFICYLALVIFTFVQQYSDYYLEQIFQLFYENVFANFIKMERDRFVMAPYMKVGEISENDEPKEDELKEEMEEEINEDEINEDEINEEENKKVSNVLSGEDNGVASGEDNSVAGGEDGEHYDTGSEKVFYPLKREKLEWDLLGREKDYDMSESIKED